MRACARISERCDNECAVAAVIQVERPGSRSLNPRDGTDNDFDPINCPPGVIHRDNATRAGREVCAQYLNAIHWPSFIM